MKYWGIPMAFIFALMIADFVLCVRGQTNLPTPPNVTMGADVLYDVQCRYCEREQKLSPIAVKIVHSKNALGGELQDFKGTFRCSKCGKEFIPPKLIPRWIRDPIRMAPRPVNIQTNALIPLPPKVKLIAPKGTR